MYSCASYTSHSNILTAYQWKYNDIIQRVPEEQRVKNIERPADFTSPTYGAITLVVSAQLQQWYIVYFSSSPP
jgi:hypothetical protein